MIETRYNGNFGLIEIKKIRKMFSGNSLLYHMNFINDKRICIITPLHCFLNENNEPKVVADLKSGDKIWIQTSELSNLK